MLVQFLTDDYDVHWGFKASFHQIPIEPSCAKWLNMTAELLESPDYPTIDCNWVITAPSISSSITIDFEIFEVKMKLFDFFKSCLHVKILCFLAWEYKILRNVSWR